MSPAPDSSGSAELSPPVDDLATRKYLGSFELKKKLGQGGMGAVYLALDPEHKRQVALKILPREKAANPQLVKRFKAEAQNAAQLTHENIVAVFGAGEVDGYLYIALEYVDGIDGHDLVERRGVLPVKRSIDIIKQVCRALQHALDQGIVHRDIKPANLLVRRDGVVKLADMGLARAVDETMETGITRAGTTVGTVDYMSPEQARNSKAADVRSDIYSLGCTWYHLLTGAPPFSEGSLTNKLHAHAKQAPPDPRDKNPNVPEGVVAVMHRMMAKSPESRYQTPNELIRDLEGALVNREAVSRKILEALDDEATESPPNSNELSWGDEESSSAPKARLKNPPAVQPGAPEHNSTIRESSATHVDLDEDPPEVARSGSQRVKTIPRREEDGRTEDTHQSHDLTDRTVSKSDHSEKSDRADKAEKTEKTERSGKQERVDKNAKAPAFRGGTPARGQQTAGVTSKTLPPPKRRDRDNPDGEQSTPPQASRMRALIITLSVVVGLFLIIYLVNLAQDLGNATAPMAGANPFEHPLPPPPAPVANPQIAPSEVPAPEEEAANVTVKEALAERKDQLEKNATIGETPNSMNGNNGSAVKKSATDKPQWVPEWAERDLPIPRLPMFSIRKGATVIAERQYATLKEALSSVPPEGARIVLFHDGPFDLAPQELHGGTVVIEAASGARPHVRLVADPMDQKLPWLSVNQGTLILDGIDLTGDATVAADPHPWTWVRVNGGHFYMRRSSMTLVGQRAGPVTAIRFQQKLDQKLDPEAKSSRILIDESVIRGDQFHCLQFDSPAFEAVVRGSLLISGAAATVSIKNGERAGNDFLRDLRIVNSTLTTRGRAFHLTATGTPAPVPTDVFLLGSLVSVPDGTKAETQFLSLEDWPRSSSAGENQGPYKNLTWTAATSAVLGFENQMVSNTNSSPVAKESAGWKKYWKEVSTPLFVKSPWPREIDGSLINAPLKSWSAKTLEKLPVNLPTFEVIPGCVIGHLQAPDLSGAAKGTALRPQRPRELSPMSSNKLVNIDLLKTDLGKFLDEKAWEDGTIFVASGNGTRYSSPIVVKNRRWRLQFRQIDGQPLIITPKPVVRSGNEKGAFITLQGGQLEIEMGTFSLESRDPNTMAPWFLVVEGGSFAMSGCRVFVAPSASKSKGIIRWAAGPGGETPLPNSEFVGIGQLTNTSLVGNGVLISAELNRRALLLRNCALAGRQHVFNLEIGSNPEKVSSAVDLQNCTILTSGTIYHLQAKSPAEKNLAPCRFFQQDCVLANYGTDSRAAPLLMCYSGGTTPTDQIVWFEEGCGYSVELKAYFSNAATPPVVALPKQDFLTEWVSRWGAGHVDRPLTSADGVFFEKPAVNSTALIRPENLKLHRSAKARTWSENGNLIGVKVELLEPPPSQTGRPGVPGRATPPDPNRVKL